MIISGGRAQLFIGLNRRGGVRAVLTVWHPDRDGELVLRWNGHERLRVPIPHQPTPLELVAPDIERGVNLLEIDAPPGTLATTLDLYAL